MVNNGSTLGQVIAVPDQEALAEAPDQEASAEPSASAAADSTVWPPETIEEALAEVLEQEGAADPSASAAGQTETIEDVLAELMEQEASADPSATAAGQEHPSLPALSVWPRWHWLSQTLQPFRCLRRLIAGRLWRI